MGLFGFAEIITNLESTAKARDGHGQDQGLLAHQGAVPEGVARGAARHGPGLGPRRAAGRRRDARRRSRPTRSRRRSPRTRREFGKGAIQGVAGPESANNAGAQTSFIPLLTLGIPENAVMALMVGAMTIHNIQPGPQVMTSQPVAVLGADRVDVGRQPDARRAEPAADRHLDQAAAGALPAPLPGDPAVLRDRRLQHQQHQRRHHADRAVRASSASSSSSSNASRRRCCSASCSAR